MSRYLDPKTDIVFKKIFGQHPHLLKSFLKIKQALDLAEEAAYTPEELAAYDQYWDAISVEKTLVGDAHQSGLEKGREQGREEGMTIGLEKGEAIGERKAKQALADKLLMKGLSLKEVVALTGLPLAIIQMLEAELNAS